MGGAPAAGLGLGRTGRPLPGGRSPGRSACPSRWWACTCCSGCTATCVDVPACMRLGRSGSRSRARAMATNAKPSASADSIVASSVMPPRRMSGVDERALELAGVGEEEGLLVGVGLAGSGGRRRGSRAGPAGGSVAPNSCRGASPRKRYIGLASELPPVSSSASSAPSASKSAATSTLSSSHRPPSHAVGHVELGRHRHVRARRRRAPCAARCGRSGRGSPPSRRTGRRAG